MAARYPYPMLLLAIAATSGCEPTSMAYRDAPPAVEVPAANVVRRVAHAEYLAFPAGAPALAGERLATFDARLSPEALGRDHLVLVAPGRPGEPLSEARAAWALEALQRSGVAAQPSSTPLAAPAQPLGDRTGVLLEIQRLQVAVPDCSSYPRAAEARVDGSVGGLLGCTNTANLGLMVADPADLVRGRPLAPSDGEAEAAAIGKYHRAGSPKQQGTNPIAEAFANAFGATKK